VARAIDAWQNCNELTLPEWALFPAMRIVADLVGMLCQSVSPDLASSIWLLTPSQRRKMVQLYPRS